MNIFFHTYIGNADLSMFNKILSKNNKIMKNVYFLAANRGKKSITIDLSKPQGQDLVRKLAASCDVLIENYKFGDLERNGYLFMSG